MIRKYVIALIINFGILTVIFVIFIFIDINVNYMVNNSIRTKLNAQSGDTSPVKKVEQRCEEYIDWGPEFYQDKDIQSDETNSLNVMISSNSSARIVFYSYKKSYYRFEVARFILSGEIDSSKFYVIVYKDKTPIKCFLGPLKLSFSETRYGNLSSWIAAWKPEIGTYEAVLYCQDYPVMSRQFEIIARTPPEFKKTISLLNLEYNQPVVKRSIYNSHLQKTNFISGVADWMNYGNIDAFFILAGETTGWGTINRDRPWEYYPLKNLETVGKEISACNKLVGAYIMCFYTPKNGWLKAGYNPALSIRNDYNNTEAVSGKFISFSDQKRFDDIVALAKYLNSIDYVDFIGFDFIRFGELSGYENADEFTRDMNIETPSRWNSYTLAEKTLWLGQKLQGNRNAVIKEQWNLWIAHKTAEFLFRVRKAAGITKPVWVFTLGWDHGREHGQDPFFFQDAGAFADFIMLYEASPDMFEAMKKSWAEYLSNEKLNYIPGNQIDYALLKSCHNNNPVEEYSYRLDWASHYSQYFSKGVFIHDISRAFWGRTGNYSSLEWLISAFSSVSYNRRLNNEIPFQIDVITNEIQTDISGTLNVPVEVQIDPSSLAFLEGKTITIENIGDKIYQKIDISKNTNIIINIKMIPKIGKVQWLGLCTKIDGYPPYFVFDYIKKNNRNVVLSKNTKVSMD